MDGISSFIDRIRPEIRTLPAYNAGLSAEYVKRRYGVAEVAKLGSNENPWGASPRVLEAVAAAVPDIALYPDPSSDELRAALSDRLGVASERFAFGNGSEDLIAVAAHSFLAPGDEMITIAPSFGLHAIYAQAIGACTKYVKTGPDYRLAIDDMIAAITPRTRMVMFSSPSNPLGTAITGGDLERLLDALRGDILLVFDEAYHEYAAASEGYDDFAAILNTKARTPWIHLRTFSKAYGLAGLRVGYGIASDAALVDVIDRARTPFNVNRLSQVAALAALDEMEFVKQCIARTVSERERVKAELCRMGYPCAPSIANFVFFNAREDASDLALRLLPHGVIVKPWREPGYTDHIRVSTGLPPANDQFLRALARERRS